MYARVTTVLSMPKYVTALLSKLRSQAGFTMIELLIVISILGFLAVAVLAAINPIEQINRGRDTSSRSDAEQLLSAIDRYYAFNGFYPWQTGAGDTPNKALDWVSFSGGTVADANTCVITDKLSQSSDPNCAGSDELKTTFVNRVTDSTYNPLFIYNNGAQGDSTYVCFVPMSKAFLTEATDRCVDENGSGLPSDIATDVKATICADGAVYTCLP